MTVLVILGMGWFVAAFGPYAWLYAGAFALLGGICVFVSLRLQPKSAHSVSTDQLTVTDPAP
jgi:PPP family 3-phenylpropionic acid transporter